MVTKPTIFQNTRIKAFRSFAYNYTFDFRSGNFKRWGHKPEIDPVWSPFGPELMDIEISAGGGCPMRCGFCSPAGTLVNTPNGKIEIEKLKSNDLVIGFDLKNNSPKIQTIQETYVRDYIGDLICIETNDGKILKLTPDHEIFTKNRGWIPVKNIKETDEILQF